MLSKSVGSRKALQRMLQADKTRARRLLANRTGRNDANSEEVEAAMSHSALLRLSRILLHRKDNRAPPPRSTTSSSDPDHQIKNLPHAPTTTPPPWLRPDDSSRGAPTELTLTEELEAFANYVSLSAVEIDSRSNFIADLREAITAKYPNATVHTYGSFDAGLSTFLSDLDLYLLREETEKHTDSNASSDQDESGEDTETMRSSGSEHDEELIGWTLDTDRAAVTDVCTSTSQQSTRSPLKETDSIAPRADLSRANPTSSSISLPQNASRDDLEVFVTTLTSRLPPASSSSSVAGASSRPTSPGDIELSDCSLLSSLHDSDGADSATDADRQRIVHAALNSTSQSNVHIHYEGADETDGRQSEECTERDLRKTKEERREDEEEEEVEEEEARQLPRKRKRALEMDLTVSVLDKGRRREHQVTDDSSLAGNDTFSDMERGWQKGRRRRELLLDVQLQREEKAQRRKAQSELEDLFRFMKSLGWVKRIEFWRGARVPIINVTHLCSVEADISVYQNQVDMSLLLRQLTANGGRAFFVLSAFLKTFLHQLQLDRPVYGGLGSFKLYVLLSLHMERYAQTLQKQTAQRGGNAVDGQDNLGLMLLSFLQYYGNPRNLNADLQLDFQGVSVSFRATWLVAPIRKAFGAAYSVLTERCRLLGSHEGRTKKRAAMAPSFLAALIDCQSLAIERQASIAACAKYPSRCDETRDATATAVVKRLQLQARIPGNELDKLLSVAKTQLPQVYALLRSYYLDNKDADSLKLPNGVQPSASWQAVSKKDTRSVKFTAWGVVGKSIAETTTRDQSHQSMKRRAMNNRVDMTVLDEKMRRMKDTIDALNMKLQRQQQQRRSWPPSKTGGQR